MEQFRPLLIHVATIARSFFYFSQHGQISNMKDRGSDVMVAAYPDETLEKFAKIAKIKPIGIKIRRSISPINDFLAICTTWYKFIKLRPDIIHAHTPKGGMVGMLSAFFAGVRLRFYHVHGLPYLTATGFSRRLLIFNEKVSCALAHRVYFVSHSIMKVAIEEGLCPAKKAKVLCNGSINGVDAIGQYNPKNYNRESILDKLDIPHDALIIGFVGRLVMDKGVRELLQSWDCLQRKYNKLYLVIIGPMEERDAIPPELKCRIKEDQRIRYLGEVYDTSSFYAAMNVLAFPSYREGFGLVALEAASMEVPVVATNIPGCIDSVVDNVTGVLIPAGDSPALQGAIERYLNDPGLSRQHGINGRKRVLADFRPEDIWDAQYADYMSLLNDDGMH